MTDQEKKNQVAECPSEETLMLFVERQLDAEQSVAVAVHMAKCRICKDKVADWVEWSPENFAANAHLLTEEEGRRGREWVAHRCGVTRIWRDVFQMFTPRQEHRAAAGGQTADQLQEEVANKFGFIHFTSTVDRQHRDYWHVRLAIPVEITPKSRVRMQVFESDGNGGERMVRKGVLTFCGNAMQVENGRVSKPVSEIDFKHNPMIALRREPGRDIPGEPVLGFGMRA